MEKIKIEFPKEFVFSTTISVRVTDLNYGAHLGNDTMLSLIHEARVQYLHWLGCKGEADIGDNKGIIMRDVAIQYRSEVHYANLLEISVAAVGTGDFSFDLYYKVHNSSTGKEAARAKSGIVCFDYVAKKPAAVPTTFLKSLESKG
ncbi:MAG: thioesterase family protein [Cyclobacteriaceae bacterium]|nr:thioesterase family protein [Cyclobacteriaceae bacterium]